MDKSFWLEIMLNATNEAVVMVNTNGIIVEISDAYLEFLGITKEKAIGKHVTRVIENTRMHIVLETGKSEYANPQKIDDQTIIATRIPVYKNGQLVGAFGRVLFKNIKELYALNDKISLMEQELMVYKSRWGGINESKYLVSDIIGNSREIKFLRDTIKLVAIRNSNILITGESGTGKELVAHAIHSSSKRRNGPLICINCGAIPAELIESELFGYTDGAFTGAKKGGKNGLFKAANGGTLFLDEIGDLPMSMQVKLLRTIQDQVVRKVGSSVGEPVDVRIVAATNKDLSQMIEQNRFRSDLYYRLNVVSVEVPPLRERREDIPLLAKHFVAKTANKENLETLSISPQTLEQLKSYDWPGNIRELENTIERAANFVGEDGEIKLHHLQRKMLIEAANMETLSLKDAVENAERSIIMLALSKHNGKKTNAAKELGISRTTFYEKMEKLGII